MVKINEEALRKCIQLILNDEWGIRYEDAYQALLEMLPQKFIDDNIKMFNSVDACEGRAFLAEDWED